MLNLCISPPEMRYTVFPFDYYDSGSDESKCVKSYILFVFLEIQVITVKYVDDTVLTWDLSHILWTLGNNILLAYMNFGA